MGLLLSRAENVRASERANLIERALRARTQDQRGLLGKVNVMAYTRCVSPARKMGKDEDGISKREKDRRREADDFAPSREGDGWIVVREGERCRTTKA